MKRATEDLVHDILDVSLYYDCFDPYWLDLPFAQSELTGRCFVKNSGIPASAIEEIAALVKQHRQAGAAM
jgi:hypothetical protein